MGLIWGKLSPDEGSWTSLFAVASPDVKGEWSGCYFEEVMKGWKLGMGSRFARDEGLAERLEEWTAKTMGDEGWVEEGKK